MLAESAERLKLAEERELLAAKVEAERLVRRRVQAAEIQLAAELDRLRWALTQAVLAAARGAFAQRMADAAARLDIVERWLAAAVAALPPGDLVAEVRAEDVALLAPQWAAITARVAAGRAIALEPHADVSLGGVRVLTADRRARCDQTFEARWERLHDELARVAMEHLFASAPDLGTLMHG
jgi:V/A-type H+-transporting ATPase subunit E